MENTEVEILLVEDSIHDAEMTIRALKQNNLSNKIVHLKNGALALNFIFGKGEYAGRDLSNKPKLILLDLKMPKVDGIEVLEALKADENTRKIPVVVLTSSKESPDIERCYELGVNSYIVKPVGFESFLEAVTKLGFYWMLLNQPPEAPGWQ
ncbi:MAG: response regulator [Chitinophagales bacterium]|nr:response regulator [Chitinophagales bacterium]